MTPPSDGRYLVAIAGYVSPDDAAEIAEYRDGQWQYFDGFTVADAGGWGKAWLPARLVTLLADLDCAETSVAIVAPLADDEPTRAHLAGLQAQADAARAEIADIVAALPTYDAEWRHAAAERLMATRTGANADHYERAAEILNPHNKETR